MKKICIIGGGASGLATAVMAARGGCAVTILERGARLGRKLSATGNGQGNVTNLHMGAEHYFSDDIEKVRAALLRFSQEDTVAFLESMGGIFLADARGRVYPASRQASAVTDLFRREIGRLGVKVVTGAQVSSVAYDGGFRLAWAEGNLFCDALVLATGGRAAPNFGTDGSAYALAKTFSHTVTPTSPALVQLRCEKEQVRGLKGIRVDAQLAIRRAGREIYCTRGDVLFTDSGVSGDAVFRASSYAQTGDTLVVDFLPYVDEKRLQGAVREGEDALLCVVNNGLARVLYKAAQGKIEKLLSLVKGYPLTVTGSLGFEYAQVTRGGIPLAEVNGSFESKKQRGLYLVGELLNVDGECGGYNLQWAFTSAYLCSQDLIQSR